MKTVALRTMLVFLLIAAVGLACASAPTAPPAPEPLPTYTPYPTYTPVSTATLQPTYTSVSTATLQPTYTPLPTYTPYPTWTPVPTATAIPSPTATRTPRPTNTRFPTLIVPTSTPLPPVSINSDCIGCPVVMPGNSTNQVIKAYREWAGAQYHPEKVLLVSCARGDQLPDIGQFMGAKGTTSGKGKDIAVKGIGPAMSQGSCYAITVQYDGLETICWESFIGQCKFGTGGTDENILSFKRVGLQTDLSATQYTSLIIYARNAEYEATIPDQK